MRLLRYEFPKDFSVENLTTEIVSLCGRNGVSSLARVRLSVIPTTYVIECWPLERSMTTLNENGLKLGIYPGGRKKCDELSNLKSSGDLIYINAAAYAEHQGWDDGLVMNEKGNIADSSISNLFIIKDGQIITPPLSEGCVSGVMRRFIMSRTSILEEPVDPDKLLTADEVFLTNAIRGIRWVKNFGNKTYSNQLTNEIYRQCM
jgi:branched-chain amino acid aminotransferase